jgi:HAD superfamily hydrolase (TIGR01549 family)
MRPEAIIFDFGGTLATGDLNKEIFSRNLIEYLRSLGYRGLEAQFRKARSNMLRRLMRVQSYNREMRLEDLYQGLLFELGVHPDRAAVEFIHELYLRAFHVKLIEGAKEIIKNLAKQFRLAILSNAISNVARRTLLETNLDKYFEKIIISRDLGIRKPDPEIFRYTLTSLDLESIQVMHVGDSLHDDIQGATSVGIPSIWIQTDENEERIQPNYIINSIRELPVFLET